MSLKEFDVNKRLQMDKKYVSQLKNELTEAKKKESEIITRNA